MKNRDKILLHLLEVKELSQIDIGKKFNLKANNLSRLLGNMERMDLIRRENVTIKNPNQGGINYIKMVYITEKGIRHATQLKNGNLTNYQNLIYCYQCEQLIAASIKNIKPNQICRDCIRSFAIKEILIPTVVEVFDDLLSGQPTANQAKKQKSKAIGDELTEAQAKIIAASFLSKAKTNQ